MGRREGRKCFTITILISSSIIDRLGKLYKFLWCRTPFSSPFKVFHMREGEFLKRLQELTLEISQKTDRELHELVLQVFTLFTSDYVQNDPQFRDDADRYIYIIRCLESQHHNELNDSEAKPLMMM